jgi:hypothetical protein
MSSPFLPVPYTSSYVPWTSVPEKPQYFLLSLKEPLVSYFVTQFRGTEAGMPFLLYLPLVHTCLHMGVQTTNIFKCQSCLSCSCLPTKLFLVSACFMLIRKSHFENLLCSYPCVVMHTYFLCPQPQLLELVRKCLRRNNQCSEAPRHIWLQPSLGSRRPL